MKRIIVIVLSIVFISVISSCTHDWDIQNPYENVNWNTFQQYKANFHTHTTVSDGSLAPQAVVDKYSKLGYQVLSITDHDYVSFPWTKFADIQPSGRSHKRVQDNELQTKDIVHENRNPSELGMIAIEGNEKSSPHHIGSYFNSFNQSVENEKQAIEAIAENNGLAIFNHPGRYKYNANWYISFFKQFDCILGIEIFNQGNRYPADRQLWDSILVKTLPERHVWGFSNDDMHRENQLGNNKSIFLLPELNETTVRHAMEEGIFFYVYTPEGYKGKKAAHIKKVDVNRKKGLINIQASGQDSILWISQGNVVHKGNTISLSECPGISVYVRAEIYGPNNAITGTQPFAIKNTN